MNEKRKAVPLFAPYENIDVGLAEVLTLTMKIKDKALKGALVMALARLESTVKHTAPAEHK